MKNLAPTASDTDLQGPLDVAAFPDTLSASVVSPGARPRIHGYDVQTDLARHYGPTDLLFLTLTGELPSDAASAALGIALTFVAPVSVAHAAVHAAVLARVCGTTVASTIGVAATGLAEQARLLLDEHAELLSWLGTQHPESPEMPSAWIARDAEERAASERLRGAIAQTGLVVPELGQTPALDAALLIVLHRCGLKERSQLETAIVTARLPCALAEAMQVKVADFNAYPTNLPRYHYSEQA
jgi:hypothetical protein